jgi:hypothetical protein
MSHQVRTKKITAQALREVFPPMSTRFETATLYTIRHLAESKENPIMKKKLSLALVIAAVLLIALSAVAFALVSWNKAAEKVAEMESDHGFFDTWTSADKVELVRILHDAGQLSADKRYAKLLTGELSETEVARLSTEIITEWIDLPESVVTFQSISERMNGSLSGWSIEDKAWLTQTLLNYNLQSPEDNVFVSPQSDDIPEHEAVRIAKNALSDAYGLTEGYLNGFAVDVMFHIPDWSIDGVAVGEAIWNIDFTMEDGTYAYTFMAALSRDGSILGTARNEPDSLRAKFDELVRVRGAFCTWTTTEQCDYLETLPALVLQETANGKTIDNYLLALSKIKLGIPSNEDMTNREAIEIAIGHIKSLYGTSDEGLGVLKVYTSFDITDPEDSIWRVKFLPWKSESYANYESTGYVIHIHAETGEIIRSLNRTEDAVSAIDLF